MKNVENNIAEFLNFGIYFFEGEGSCLQTPFPPICPLQKSGDGEEVMFDYWSKVNTKTQKFAWQFNGALSFYYGLKRRVKND